MDNDVREIKIFDNPGTVKKFRRGFYILCALLLSLDLFIHKHGEFKWEEWPLTYALFGFVSCIVLIIAAAIFRFIVSRKEDYYG